MALLDRYISREMATTFLFGVAFFTVFLIVNHLIFLARVIVQNDASLSAAAGLLVYRLPYLLGFSLPMATLLATILSFGRMNEHQEVTALRTSGVSLWRIARPALVAGLAVGLLTLAFNEQLVPASERRYNETYRREIARRPPGAPGRQNLVFRDTLDGQDSLVIAQQFDRATRTMRRLVVNQFRDGRVTRMIQAEEAVWTERTIEFRRGRMYALRATGTVIAEFAVLRVSSRVAPSMIPDRIKRPDEMTVAELRVALRAPEALGQNRAALATQLQLRFAVPLASLAFVLLGIPVSLRAGRSGRSIGLGLTVVVIFAYYLLLSVGTSLGEAARLPAALAAWLPNVILGFVGGRMLARQSG